MNKFFKKTSYDKRKGELHVKLYDADYNLLYKNKGNVANKKEINKIFTDLKAKGLKTYEKTEWF